MLATKLHERGIRIWVDGDKLVVQANPPLTDDLRQFIRDNKPALIAEIAGGARSEKTQSLDALSAIWRVRTPIYDIDVVYPAPVDLARVQADYPDAERIRMRGKKT